MKYKIIQLLKTFTPKEVKDFDKFLRSPFFNESSKVHSLYKILLKYYPEFDSSKLSEENLSRQLNPKLPYNKSTFKRLLFDLGNLADEYLKLIGFSEYGTGSEDFLRHQYFKRRLYKYFRQNIDEAEAAFMEIEHLTFNSYIDLIKLQNDKLNYYVSNHPNSGKEFVSEVIKLHSERSRLLANVFANEVIRGFDNLMAVGWSHNIKSKNNYTSYLFDLINFENLFVTVLNETANSCQRLNLELNIAMLRMFKESDIKFYYDYKDLVKRITPSITADLINSHLIRMIKYCQRKIAAEDSRIFHEELFDIIKTLIEGEYYKHSINNLLPVALFRMALITALEVDQKEWALSFINSNHKKLPPDNSENMRNFGMALYNFHTGNFEDALNHINKIKLNQFILKIDYKNLMLMIYYELGMYEAAISLIDSYKHFVSNGDVLNERMNSKLKNFIFIAEKLLKHKTELRNDVLHLIEKRIAGDMHNKKWIVSKVKEISEKISV